MAKLSFTDCFAKYGSKLINPMWAVSAEASDGSIVISCWSAYLSRPDNSTLRYSDTLSRWKGNTLGNNLLRTHLERAKEEALPIRLVIASTTDTAVLDSGADASKIAKRFHFRRDLVGQLVTFDGDLFVIDFQPAADCD